MPWLLEVVHQLYDKLMTQCGIGGAILGLVVVAQAIQQARTRAGWDADRQGLMNLIVNQNKSFENLALSRLKLAEIREQSEAGSDY